MPEDEAVLAIALLVWLVVAAGIAGWWTGGWGE